MVHNCLDLKRIFLIFAENFKDMAVLVTSREFREKQAYVFDLADQGEKVVIRRKQKQAYALVPIQDEELTTSISLQAKVNKKREELKSEIMGAIQQVKDHMAGKIELKTLDDLINEL